MAEIEHIMGWPAEEFAVQLRHAGDELPEVCALQKDYVRFAADTIDTLRHQLAQSQAALRLGHTQLYSASLYRGYGISGPLKEPATVMALREMRAALAPHDAGGGEPFPQPRRKDGGEPCGECHIQPGETCDICGAYGPDPDRLREDRDERRALAKE